MEYKRVVGEVETNSQYQCIAGQIRCAVQTIEFGVLKRIKQRVKAVKINRGQCADIVLTFSSGVSGSFEFVKEVLDLLDNPETYQSASEVNRDPANIPESSTSQKTDKASRWRIQELCLYSLAELDRCLEMGEVYQSQCSDVEFWRTALRMSIIAPNTSEASHTELSYIFREFAWSVDVIRLAFTAFKVLLTAGLDLLQQYVALEWCARSCRLVLNTIGDYNILQENYSVLQSSSVKDSDEKELLRMLKEVAVNKLRLPSAYQKQRSKIASFLRQKMEGPGARTDYLPTTFEIDHRDITLKDFWDNRCASVEECTWQGEMVAVKHLNISNPKARKTFENEVTLLASVQHPNIVQLLGFAYEEKENRGVIVMELMQMNLRNLIDHKRNRIEEGTVPTFHDDSTPFPLDVAIYILLQNAEAMCHLRGLRVMHRDLKAINILVNQCNHKRSVPSGTRCKLQSKRESFYHVKLADFGMAKSLPLASKFHTKMGTLCWMAPEVLEVENNRGHKSGEYTWSADVYSFGITCSEVLTGLLPFERKSRAGLLNKIRTGERPPLPLDCPASLRKIINDCWATNATRRPDFLEIREKLWRCRLEMLLNDGKLSMSQNFQDKLRAVSSSSESPGPGDGLGHALLASLSQKIFGFNLKKTADRSPSQQTEEDIRKAAKGDLAIVHTYSELQEATRDFHPSIQNKGGDKETKSVSGVDKVECCESTHMVTVEGYMNPEHVLKRVRKVKRSAESTFFSGHHMGNDPTAVGFSSPVLKALQGTPIPLITAQSGFIDYLPDAQVAGLAANDLMLRDLTVKSHMHASISHDNYINDCHQLSDVNQPLQGTILRFQSARDILTSKQGKQSLKTQYLDGANLMEPSEGMDSSTKVSKQGKQPLKAQYDLDQGSRDLDGANLIEPSKGMDTSTKVAPVHFDCREDEIVLIGCHVDHVHGSSELFFISANDMAQIVGVGLEFAKVVIHIDMHVEVLGMSKEDWIRESAQIMNGEGESYKVLKVGHHEMCHARSDDHIRDATSLSRDYITEFFGVSMQDGVAGTIAVKDLSKESTDQCALEPVLLDIIHYLFPKLKSRPIGGEQSNTSTNKNVSGMRSSGTINHKDGKGGGVLSNNELDQSGDEATNGDGGDGPKSSLDTTSTAYSLAGQLEVVVCPSAGGKFYKGNNETPAPKTLEAVAIEPRLVFLFTKKADERSIDINLQSTYNMAHVKPDLVKGMTLVGIIGI